MVWLTQKLTRGIMEIISVCKHKAYKNSTVIKKYIKLVCSLDLSFIVVCMNVIKARREYYCWSTRSRIVL